MPIMPAKNPTQTRASRRLDRWTLSLTGGCASLIPIFLKRPTEDVRTHLHDGDDVDHHDEGGERHAQRDRTVAARLLLLVGQLDAVITHGSHHATPKSARMLSASSAVKMAKRYSSEYPNSALAGFMPRSLSGISRTFQEYQTKPAPRAAARIP